MKPAIVVLVTLHALLHLLGAAKAFKWAELNALSEPISRPWGLWWIFAFVVLLTAVLLYLFQAPYWWVVGLMAISFSQFLIFHSWPDAKWGTVVNVIFLLPIVLALLPYLPWSFQSRYKREVALGLSRSVSPDLLTEEDLQALPMPVRHYLRYTGSVGKPKVLNCKAEFEGEMKTSLKADWAPIKAVQYNFFHPLTRLFLVESNLKGIPYDGWHVYKEGQASMQIRVASLFDVVTAKGDRMNQSETVTVFNDMCILAPASLIDKRIQWQTIDSLTVNAAFTNQTITIHATLHFNTEGQLVRFVSDDRYLSSDGKTFLLYRWSTPVGEYKEMGNRKLATFGKAIWELPEGDFTYARFVTKSIVYNVKNY